MNQSKDQTIIALKKAKSSIEKIISMVDNDKYCIEIIQQILAVQGLLKSSSEKLLKNHLNHCFTDGIATNDKVMKEKLINELLNVIKISSKS